MDEKTKDILKKAAKIAGAACITLGAVTVATCTAAVNAAAEGGKLLAENVKKIINDEPAAEPQVVDAEVVSEADVVAEEADFAEPETQPQPESAEE